MPACPAPRARSLKVRAQVSRDGCPWPARGSQPLCSQLFTRRTGPRDQLTTRPRSGNSYEGMEADLGSLGPCWGGCTRLFTPHLCLSCQEAGRNQLGTPLTLEPGGPTRPAAPGNPVAPYVGTRQALNPSGPQEAHGSEGQKGLRGWYGKGQGELARKRARGSGPRSGSCSFPASSSCRGLPRARDLPGPLHTSREGSCPPRGCGMGSALGQKQC